MFGHVIPGVASLRASIPAQRAVDYYLVWLVFLLVLRYWRTAPEGCTAICATVGPEGDTVFDELIAAVLVSRPARLVFACNTVLAAEQVRRFLADFRVSFEAGKTRYQRAYSLPGFAFDKHTEISVVDVNVSNKRQQLVAGMQYV
ncbi:uncharacterized protein M421DRAFT_287 [Didymella exigua CBS 183.55]|uniref:Uncharacterized protein n=1 Tax=Didymella exigua CBS 183.55 TaxID=1150837 RepID=A0A6A5S2J3_9PLEO|nr:uncharacterized protein M421DRAFT_287 [Didymella exigua CBS 183.55]KAF1934133.1 hypothetical protein M421DRAFT_287 [Didymella exigua CBS 183.55]